VTRAERLSGRKAFEAVRSGGVSARGDAVRLRVLAGDRAASRLGLAVRGSTTAVQRNRARRRLRSAMTAELRTRPGVDVIVSANARDAAELPYRVLLSDVSLALGRALAPRRGDAP